MTPDVVARAIELCESESRYWAAWQFSNSDLYEHGEKQFRSWQANLAEIKEHSARDWDFFKDGDTFLVAPHGMVICDKCKWIYPCDAVRLKAKRLLGEEM